MKADRTRLKGEKTDLVSQMQQLYATLESREEQLRDFIRSYEQHRKVSAGLGHPEDGGMAPGVSGPDRVDAGCWSWDSLFPCLCPRGLPFTLSEPQFPHL